MRAAFRKLGFTDLVAVAIGADLCTLQKAEDYVKEGVYEKKLPFMGTSCCPAWSVMAKKGFSQFSECISMAFTSRARSLQLL